MNGQRHAGDVINLSDDAGSSWRTVLRAREVTVQAATGIVPILTSWASLTPESPVGGSGTAKTTGTCNHDTPYPSVQKIRLVIDNSILEELGHRTVV